MNTCYTDPEGTLLGFCIMNNVPLRVFLHCIDNGWAHLTPESRTYLRSMAKQIFPRSQPKTLMVYRDREGNPI